MPHGSQEDMQIAWARTDPDNLESEDYVPRIGETTIGRVISQADNYAVREAPWYWTVWTNRPETGYAPSRREAMVEVERRWQEQKDPDKRLAALRAQQERAQEAARAWIRSRNPGTKKGPADR